LFSRSLSDNGIDSRFVNLKKNIYSFTTAWTAQALWVFLCSLPVYMLNSFPVTNVGLEASVKISDIVGCSIWLLGFLFEAVADEQKRQFRVQSHSKKADHDHHSLKFIRTGLWSLSRHPNYFGEICVWIGLYVLCCGGFHHPLQYVLGAVSPIFIFSLLVYVSGIPLLETAGNKKWGNDESYKRYKERTPVLVPFVGRTGDSAF
jgi:steroid 5-alpha reductase family enzyme